jgi:hypothetical protein
VGPRAGLEHSGEHINPAPAGNRTPKAKLFPGLISPCFVGHHVHRSVYSLCSAIAAVTMRQG